MSQVIEQKPNDMMKEVLPKTGSIFNEDLPSAVLCKPKILPLKSVTLEKLEKMQKEAQDTMRAMEAVETETKETF